MKKLRYFFALFLAKLSKPLLKITGHHGTDFPGLIALKICPNFLEYIHKPNLIIGVTGTNGKTTCSNLLSDALNKFGNNVLNNSEGSNTITGICTSFINNISIFGRIRRDIAVLELDERSARLIFPNIKPNILLVTNLSRDSIMRNGHPEFISYILERYMPKETKLILNADDLISSNLSHANHRIYYGIDSLPGDKTECTNLINDMQICPICHSKLTYEYNRYSNIGKALCTSCNYKSPEYDYEGCDIDFEKRLMTISHNNIRKNFKIFDPSIFNIYNQIAVVSLLSELGYTLDDLSSIFNNLEITKSRLDNYYIGNIFFQAILCKDRNAYAASRVFEYINSQDGDKEILLYCNSFNDAKEWSENTCWLYDCDFELLTDKRIKRIILCHDRRYDYKLRLLNAGVEESRIICTENPLDGVNDLLCFDNDNIYLLYGLLYGENEKIIYRVKEKIISVLKQKAKNLEER